MVGRKGPHPSLGGAEEHTNCYSRGNADLDFVGLCLAFLVSRTNIPTSSLFEYISIVPFITPPIIAGLAWILLAETKRDFKHFAESYRVRLAVRRHDPDRRYIS